MGSEASTEEIASLYTPDRDWNISDDSAVLSWVGRKTGREAISDFICNTQIMVERVSLDIKDVLASDDRAVTLSHLKTHLNATGKLIDSTFSIALTFSDPKIASICDAGRLLRRIDGHPALKTHIRFQSTGS